MKIINEPSKIISLPFRFDNCEVNVSPDDNVVSFKSGGKTMSFQLDWDVFPYSFKLFYLGGNKIRIDAVSLEELREALASSA